MLAGDQMPAVVLVDIDMPIMDGFAVVERMRSLPAFAEIPTVLFYSNSDNPLDRERAERLGSRLQQKYVDLARCVAFLEGLVAGV